MASKLGYQDIEWLPSQVWHTDHVPYDMNRGILHFLDANMDMAEVKTAIELIEPYVVVPATGETFTDSTMNAHLIRNDPEYHTGIIVPGKYDELIKRIKWAVAQGFAPIVLHPGNFQGKLGQDKDLWQMYLQGAWIKGAWYHLATNRPHALQLPGRWSVGEDFTRAGQ